MHVHVHVHTEDSRLDEILSTVRAIDTRSRHMATDLSQLTTEVQQATDAQQSAITLITGLAQAVRDAATDPAALAALADQLDSSSTALADAVSANTPQQAPPPAPAPEPAPAEPPAPTDGTPPPPADQGTVEPGQSIDSSGNPVFGLPQSAPAPGDQV